MSSRSIMGFDYGTKSIGVAIGQELTGSARPLRSLKANDGIPNWEEIEKLIKEWQPDLLIVGLPLNMDGTDQEITVRARKFGNRLHGRFGKPVEFKTSTKAWRNALKRAGIENFRWHDLRHTWASWHAQGGTPMHVLQKLGGWQTPAMVQRYAHLGMDDLKRYAEQVRIQQPAAGYDLATLEKQRAAEATLCP